MVMESLHPVPEESLGFQNAADMVIGMAENGQDFDEYALARRLEVDRDDPAFNSLMHGLKKLYNTISQKG